MNRGPLFALIVLVLLAGPFVVWLLGSGNEGTPAGYVGYVTQRSIFGHSAFVGTQMGPTSTGRMWLVDVTNVSVTPYTYNEEFDGPSAILSKDNLKLTYAVHVVFRINPDRVKDFVERYATIYDQTKPDELVKDAYDNFMKEPLRTYSRDELQQFAGLQIKDNIGPIGATIQQKVVDLCKDTPFDVKSVVVGNIQYPAAVSDAVSDQMAATQKLLQKQTEIDIAAAEAKRRVVEAHGIADSMDIINQKLTAAYLQHEAIDAQKTMINSPNHTVIYIPVGPMGVPITLTEPAEQPSTNTTEKK